MKKKKINLLNQERGLSLKGGVFHLRIVLIYPNYYHIGMSNLGFQTVYGILNDIKGVRCERAFLPYDQDIKSTKIITVESKTEVNKFDIIAFSISFEDDIIHFLDILTIAGIPLFSKEREENCPLILVGGVLTILNPEPLSSFVDCFLIGEIELKLEKFIENFNTRVSKKNNLKKLSRQISNLYVPLFFELSYNRKGLIRKVTNINNMLPVVNRAINSDITVNPARSSIITPNTIFKDVCLIEVSRGCNHGCRFCSAGNIYKPARFQSRKVLENKIGEAIHLTNRIGLISPNIADHPNIGFLFSEEKWKKINFSFSSIRAKDVDKEFVSILKERNVKTVTIAPDAGSERLRNVINKRISEEDILKSVEKVVLAGIFKIRMYFIIGLPTETHSDLLEMISLCKRIKKSFLDFSRFSKRVGSITISLNAFVPKPFTPFQWVKMEKMDILKKKIMFVKKNLKNVSNLKVNSYSVKHSFIQALIARGDRKIAKFLLLANKNSNNWMKVLNDNKKELAFYVNRKRNFREILPWDFLNGTISKQFLLEEYKAAMNQVTSSPSCNNNIKCKLCGVCS